MLFIYLFTFGVGDWTQGLVHDKSTLYFWITLLAHWKGRNTHFPEVDFEFWVYTFYFSGCPLLWDSQGLLLLYSPRMTRDRTADSWFLLSQMYMWPKDCPAGVPIYLFVRHFNVLNKFVCCFPKVNLKNQFVHVYNFLLGKWKKVSVSFIWEFTQVGRNACMHTHIMYSGQNHPVRDLFWKKLRCYLNFLKFCFVNKRKHFTNGFLHFLFVSMDTPWNVCKVIKYSLLSKSFMKVINKMIQRLPFFETGFYM